MSRRLVVLSQDTFDFLKNLLAFVQQFLRQRSRKIIHFIFKEISFNITLTEFYFLRQCTFKEFPMFIIPSKQIPDLFDAKVVNEDFEIICKRASSVLGISTQKLIDALQQSAEDELQHRFQKAIQKVRTEKGSAKTKETPKETKTQLTKCPMKQTRCSVEACVVKKITKPQYIDGKLYCAAHYKQVKSKQFPLSLSSKDFIPGSLEGHTNVELDSPPKPILNEEHRAYWSCVPISYVDRTGQEVHYKLHKPTGIILDKITQEDGHMSFALIGHYDEDNFTDKSDVDPKLLDWCKQSGIIV